MIDSRFDSVLRLLYSNLDITEINWAITGSLGLVLQGMDLEVHDLDIQTDKAGAYDVERCFSQYVVRKVKYSSTDKICSHFGELSIDGIKVEIMGDIQKRLPNGKWEDPVDLTGKRTFARYNELSIPVISLEYECEAYYKLGRLERAKQIEGYLGQSHSRTWAKSID